MLATHHLDNLVVYGRSKQETKEGWNLGFSCITFKLIVSASALYFSGLVSWIQEILSTDMNFTVLRTCEETNQKEQHFCADKNGKSVHAEHIFDFFKQNQFLL